MGLTIVAYQTVIPYAELDDDLRKGLDDDDYLEIKNHDGFKGYLAPLEPGRYLAPESSREYLGGYQYHVAWRAWLEEAFGESGSFPELINFTETDGFMGPYAVRSVSGDLGAREAEVEAVAERTVPDADTRAGYVQTYRQLFQCFEAAGYDGVVQFT